MLVIAACGGGSDEPTTTEAPSGGDGTTTTAADQTTTSTAGPTANPSDDFCEFIVAYAEDVDFSPVGLNPDEIEELFTSNLDAIDQAADLAPNELRGDVLRIFDEAFAVTTTLLLIALLVATLGDPVEGPEARAEAVRILGADPGLDPEEWRKALGAALKGGAR